MDTVMFDEESVSTRIYHQISDQIYFINNISDKILIIYLYNNVYENNPHQF